MKSCPKCNRTFPDEGQKFCTFDGGLLIAQQTFDPNATIRATSAELAQHAAESPEKATSRELPDPNATIVESYAQTIALPRTTGPTGGAPTTGEFAKPAPPPPAAPPPPLAPTQTNLTAPPAAVPAATQPSIAVEATQPPSAPLVPKKKSKMPWIIGGLVLLLLLGGGGAAGVFFLVVKPLLAEKAAQKQSDVTPTVAEKNTNGPEVKPSVAPSATPEDSFVAPPNTIEFQNSNTNLDGKLAEHYFDFSFYYPNNWRKDPKAGVPGATNFVGVERTLDNFPQENFSVGWYTSTGTFIGDLPTYQKRVEEFSSALAKQFPEYRKVSDGPTMINSMQGYEFRWEGLSKGTEKGDVNLWGRVVFLPTGNEGDTAGATLTMFSTSLADELRGVDDVGLKGQMPVILDSFRFGKRK